MTKTLTLYLRREPSVDLTGKLDVVAYPSLADAKARKVEARWSWYQTKPTRRNKRVTLNCYQWAVVWLPDLVA